MACKLPLSLIAQRLTMASYKGQPSSSVSSNYNYAYALSDTIPAGRFWLLWYASVISLQTGGSARNGLWAINPGILPFANLVPYARSHAFFQGDIIATITNGPPVGPYARRIDEINDNNVDNYFSGAEQVAVRTKKVILPEGYTLMAGGQAGGFGIGGTLGEQYQLNIVYAEFTNDEAEALIGPVNF